MSFREKSVLIVISALVIVTITYAAALVRLAKNDPTDEIPYQAPLLVAVILMVIVMVAGHAVAAAVGARGAGGKTGDGERIVAWRGQAARGIVLAGGAILVLGMALVEVSWFWIANTLAAALVLAEIVAGVWTLALLRRQAHADALMPH